MKYQETHTFKREWKRLTREERALAVPAFQRFIAACNAASEAAPVFPVNLRVKRVQGTSGIWEMTCNHSRPDGRATFQFVTIDGETGILWRRIGGHEIFDDG